MSFTAGGFGRSVGRISSARDVISIGGGGATERFGGAFGDVGSSMRSARGDLPWRIDLGLPVVGSAGAWRTGFASNGSSCRAAFGLEEGRFCAFWGAGLGLRACPLGGSCAGLPFLAGSCSFGFCSIVDLR